MVVAGGGFPEEIALFLQFETGKNIESPIRCAVGLIWAEMREQQEVNATGQWENEEGRVENRLFQISVREVISMLAGRRSNEESSILKLQSGFPIASCGVVAWRWLDELSALSLQNVDVLSCTLHFQSHTFEHPDPHMET